MKKEIRTLFYLILGWLAVILGIVGIFLPLLPTTPFALLATYAFARSSPKMHQWILKQKRLGPLIQRWQLYRVIPLRAKITATLLITLLFSLSLSLAQISLPLQIGMGLIIALVLIYIWRHSHHFPTKNKRE